MIFQYKIEVTPNYNQSAEEIMVEILSLLYDCDNFETNGISLEATIE